MTKWVVWVSSTNNHNAGCRINIKAKLWSNGRMTNIRGISHRGVIVLTGMVYTVTEASPVSHPAPMNTLAHRGLNLFGGKDDIMYRYLSQPTVNRPLAVNRAVLNVANDDGVRGVIYDSAKRWDIFYYGLHSGIKIAYWIIGR